ncbi:MAG TPA: PRC-barrel domain containing protein [Actinomycetes bacterium]|nr:PRC-barrel domain containing protein [Actinomycetes bacterium]
MYNLWSYRQQLIGIGELENLTGYEVVATDGTIGSIEQASDEAGSSHILVSAGTWIFGKKIMLPAGTIARIDHVERKIYVDRDKEEIKRAPKYDEELRNDPGYHSQLDEYYGRAGM